MATKDLLVGEFIFWRISNEFSISYFCLRFFEEYFVNGANINVLGYPRSVVEKANHIFLLFGKTTIVRLIMRIYSYIIYKKHFACFFVFFYTFWHAAGSKAILLTIPSVASMKLSKGSSMYTNATNS